MRELVFILIILLTSFLVRGMDCYIVEGNIECKVPISLDIEKDNSKWSLELDSTELLEKNESILIVGHINNPTKEDIFIEYYAYGYKGSKCLTCNTERNESIFEVHVKANDTYDFEIKLNGKFLENSSFKIKYKEKKLKSWKEIKGSVVKEVEIVERQFIEESVTESVVKEVEEIAPKSKSEEESKEVFSSIDFVGSKSLIQIYVLFGVLIIGIVLWVIVSKKGTKPF